MPWYPQQPPQLSPSLPARGLVVGLLATAALLGCLTAPTPSRAGQTIRIGGTGSALAAMRVLGTELTRQDPGTNVEVLPSLGTPGGIEALAEGAIDIALAARALKPEEAAKGVREAACMTTALVFAANHQDPGHQGLRHKDHDHQESEGLRPADLPALFRDPSPTWADGTALKIILRPRSGSEYPYLIKVVPEMGAALDEAHQRRGIPVGATDQENVDIAQRTKGSLAIASLLQLRAEELPLRPLPLDGVEPSAETLADGSYPFPYRICLLLPAQPSAAGQRFVSFVASPEGRNTLRALGALEETKANP
jgi:phosphate transport system substrate-binding protein